MSLINSGRGWLVLLVGGLLVTASPATAYDRTALEQRLAERRAQIEARRAEREAARAEQGSDETEPAVEETCRCTAKLGFSKPSLQWRDGKLLFTPKVDVSIRSRGEERIVWTARLSLEGVTGYKSTDVTVPAGVGFNGSYELFSGQCGDTYSYSGWQLPAVELGGLTRNLAKGQEVDGRVQMQAWLTGCGEDSEKKAFDFTLTDFGNMKVRSWRNVR